MMISSPNWLALRTSTVASRKVWNRSSRVSAPPASLRASASRRTQFSTMMTAASTISPKSMAPRLIRFADTPNRFIPMIATSIDNGITLLTINPARSWSKNRNKTKTTSTPPCSRL